MRVPLSWLREFVPVAEDASAEDLMATLVKVGLEEEDVHRPSDELSGPIVVGQIFRDIAVKQHNEDIILEVPAVHTTTQIVSDSPYRAVQLSTFLLFLIIYHKS